MAPGTSKWWNQAGPWKGDASERLCPQCLGTRPAEGRFQKNRPMLSPLSHGHGLEAPWGPQHWLTAPLSMDHTFGQPGPVRWLETGRDGSGFLENRIEWDEGGHTPRVTRRLCAHLPSVSPHATLAWILSSMRAGRCVCEQFTTCKGHH